MTAGAPTDDGLFDAFTVVGFGAIIDIKVDHPNFVPLLRDHLPERVFITPRTTPDATIIVMTPPSLDLDAQPSKALADLLDDFDSQLRFMIAQFSREKIFVHGGAVSWRGVAVIFPGHSYSGKSHLVSELIKAGADYISDEHAILDEAGFLHPWLKPLSIRIDGNARQRNVPPADFGAIHVSKAVPVRLIISTKFDPEAVWKPALLPTAQGALELMANAVAARIHPERVMRVVSETARRATTYKSGRPDAAEVIPDILEMLDELASAPESTC